MVWSELFELTILAVNFLFDCVEDKAIFLDGEVVIVDFILEGFLEFLDFLLFESEVEVGDGHGEGGVCEDEEFVNFLFFEGFGRDVEFATPEGLVEVVGDFHESGLKSKLISLEFDTIPTALFNLVAHWLLIDNKVKK